MVKLSLMVTTSTTCFTVYRCDTDSHGDTQEQARVLVHASASLICRWSWTRVREPFSLSALTFPNVIPSASDLLAGLTTRSYIGPARKGPSAGVIACVVQDVDPEQCQDPNNEYSLFAVTTYEADEEEAKKIDEQVTRASQQNHGCSPARPLGKNGSEFSVFFI